MVASLASHEKGVAKFGKPAYSSPLAARHGAETKVEAEWLERWRSRSGAGLRVVEWLATARGCGEVSDALNDKNSSASC